MTVLEWYRNNRDKHPYKMSHLYAMVGISKQGHYKRLKKRNQCKVMEDAILKAARLIRQEHKNMGCRKLYSEIKPIGYGRDKTEQLLLSNGFRVAVKRNYTRTTYAGVHRFKNLISGLYVTDINQLWVSDITYIPVTHKKHYYLTLIQDVYSRLVVGWSLSENMLTENTVFKAYKRAIKTRKNTIKGLIFHSDRGSQYSSKMIQEIHKKHKVKPSMGNKAWENAHAESLNGVLKNEYINLEQSKSLLKAQKQVKKWIDLYNQKRPHGALNNQKPETYETLLETLSTQEKPIVKINY